MASEMVKAATSEKLKEMDWAKNIEICELVAQDPGKAKDVIKSIKKCVGSRSKNAQLYAVMVIDNGLLPILVKIVKKKTELPVREKIFLLLDATQTSLGGAKGKFPQYYEAYYELVSAGVKFSNCPNVVITQVHNPVPEAIIEPNKDNLSSRSNGVQQEANVQPVSDTSIIRKASSVMEVLRDVLNSMDPRHPEGATDEFVLDLVEQCTFQKQRIMHLVMTSRDEVVVSQCIELNEELQKVLVRHDTLLSVHPTTTTVPSNLKEDEEEEDAESLYRRLRKGKALLQDHIDESMPSFRSIPVEKMRRPLTIQPPLPDRKPTALNIRSPDHPEARPDPAVLIPPPPAKHAERERFFREKSMDGGNLPGHLRGLSSQSSRDGSSSCSGSTDYGD
ncbi:TOM1-like protein 5 isoform X2 [Triticum dicoccoides]|uniref:TOM1-like protein 5 isoform X2 n=1 Tax=Triticum dicoccoides TaxID=85692 RepID=UPI001891A38E|nr:TOM1-like protein 5 isoform X2 [Triticum dicoccoides]XP_044431858.1 TOM1-like protein 5 isoform X2 [Triticum aestivum]